jgi:hypothetical protein
MKNAKRVTGMQPYSMLMGVPGGLLGKQSQSGNMAYFFLTTRAQSEKVGQISFHPPNFFLPVRP